MKSKEELDGILLENEVGLPYHISVYEHVLIKDEEIVSVDLVRSDRYQTDRFKHYSPYKPISKMFDDSK